jgi:hypothetical protein
MHLKRLFRGTTGVLLSILAIVLMTAEVRADEEGSCSACERGACRGACRSWGHKICGHDKKDLPIVANPECFGYFQTQWRVWPCPNPTIEPEKEMPKAPEEPPVKPAVYSKKTNVLKVQPAVRTLSQQGEN